MSVSKMDIFEKLIKGYVKAPPSFKEQTITTLAIQLCQNMELKKAILYESERLQNIYVSWLEWEKLIEERSSNICHKLLLPPVLKNKLISRIRHVALHIYNWNSKQDMFNISPLNINISLNPSDWIVVEMKLNEKKIAKRLVQDERIPVCQRYRMACFHCIEYIISSLWNQISPKRRSDLILDTNLKLVRRWSSHFDRDFKEIPRNTGFWCDLLEDGICDGSMSTILQCWGKLDMNVRQGVLRNITWITELLSLGFKGSDADIFCFLLTQISEVQSAEFFPEIVQNPDFNVLLLFLHWPYQDLLVPIIKELWNILPEEIYEDLLSTLGSIFCDEYDSDVEKKYYRDCDYEFLIIELLEETPDHFKRYVFFKQYEDDMFSDVTILYNILNKGHQKIHYTDFFKRIWKHVTLEEKGLFLRSHYGKRLCYNLATQDNWELFNSILRECLYEGEIPIFKKEVLDGNKKNIYADDR